MISLYFPQIMPPTIEQALEACIQITKVEEGSLHVFVIYTLIHVFSQKVDKVVNLYALNDISEKSKVLTTWKSGWQPNSQF